MKSFQNFAYNIVENRTTSGFGAPSGYDDQGEPKYTKRPGPKEPGRRATVQKSPKTVSQVKGEIAAAKRFAGVRSGGLDTRTVPSFVTQRRQDRASRLLGPNPWNMPGGAGGGQKTFDRGMRKLVPSSGPSKGHQERALRDFVKQSSKELGTSTDEIIASMMRGKSATPLASPVAAPDPWRPSETATTPPKPKPVSQAAVSKKQAAYREAQKNPPAQKATTAAGGTPKAVSFTPSRSKSTSPKASVVDVTAKTVPGTRVAEPKPKTLPGLKLGTDPAGPLVSNRPGESKTIRPQKGPGRTGVLAKPKAGQMTGAKIEPVRVRDITSTPKITTSLPQAKTAKVTLPKPPKPSLKPKVVAPTVAAVKPKELKIPKPTTPKIKPLSATRTSQSQRLADTVVKASKQIRSDIAAERAAERAKVMKGIGAASKALGVIGTGIEAKKGYDIAKAMGSSRKRSVGAGAARAIGSGLGGVVGGAIGSPLGPLGSAAGATAGLTVGAELGSKAYDVITGDPKKKVTTQGVLTNIRKAVPQEVRAKVPADVRKGFTDFVKSAGKTYGNWQRSQETKK